MVTFAIRQVWQKAYDKSMQGTVKGERKQGRQGKRCKGNIREWTGLVFNKPQREVSWMENEKTGLWCPNEPFGSKIDESGDYYGDGGDDDDAI